MKFVSQSMFVPLAIVYNVSMNTRGKGGKLGTGYI
jgi:hypothetical protein